MSAAPCWRSKAIVSTWTGLLQDEHGLLLFGLFQIHCGGVSGLSTASYSNMWWNFKTKELKKAEVEKCIY